MLPIPWLIKLIALRFCLGYVESIAPLRIVDRSHYPKRRSLPTRKLNYGFHRDSPSLMDNVIHSPLDNKRVYTKESFYINAIRPKEREAILYESMLMDGKGSTNEIDAFFVTAPPSRTTLAPKRTGDFDLPDLVNDLDTVISQRSVGEDELLAFTSTTTKKPDLKLVTLPPVIRNTVPPFKHNSPVRRQTEQPFTLQPPIRFPAQSWQIPPLHIPSTPNPLAQFFQPPPNPQIPPNPFFPQWTPPPPPPPAPIVTNPPTIKNSSFEQFIPIPVGQPQPPILFPNRFDNNRQHVPLGTFARNVGQQPIPLPDPAAIDTAFNQAKEREMASLLPSHLVKKAAPPIDFSIDNVAAINKDFRPPPPQNYRPVEKASEQLSNFVKVHPHVMSNIQKPLIYRGKEVVIPKMFNFTQPSPSVQPPTLRPIVPQPPPHQPTSYLQLMNPNQKLDLCCRKQRVGPICQNLCNFDSFNDKTLVTAFLTNQCPGPQLGQAYDCASSKVDHSPCCERAGLANFQGGKCMTFCQTHLSTPANVLDYFVCLQVFEHIKGCYRDYQFNHPNIFGD